MMRFASRGRAGASAGLGAAVLSLACAGIAAACDIDVPDDYLTIQEAIDAAQAGDVICVHPGTYNESIDFDGKAITLKADSMAVDL